MSKNNYTTVKLHIEDRVLKEIKRAMWVKNITGYNFMIDEQAWNLIIASIEKGLDDVILRKGGNKDG